MGRRTVKKIRRKVSDKAGVQRKQGSAAPRLHPLVNLQRSVGSQAVQRLIESPYIQTKLQVSEPQDETEKEADRTAESVMRTEEPTGRTAASPTPGPGVEGKLANSGPASPLPNTVRNFMEPRLGADLSDVRVHTGREAAQLSDQFQAQAFTHGKDVYFGAGKSPGIDTLTAHELTHVVQQTGGLNLQLISRNPADDRKKAAKLKGQLKKLIAGAVWKEIRKRVYPKESAAGITRAKERKAGSLTDLTGLGKITALESFATAMKKVQKDWRKKSAKSRVKAIGDAINEELKTAGVPEFLIVDTEKTEFKGSFGRGLWQFLISEDLVKQSTLSNADAAELANTAMHEARHAEQQFLAARFSAGPPQNKSAPDIAAEQGIPEDPIAKAAVAAKFDAATDPTVADLGKQMFKATVTDAVANQAISDDDFIKEMKDAREEAVKSRAALKKSITSATLADAEAKRDKLKDAIAEVERRYTLYRNIPYEADAHEVGDAAEEAFKGWPP